MDHALGRDKMQVERLRGPVPPRRPGVFLTADQSRRGFRTVTERIVLGLPRQRRRHPLARAARPVDGGKGEAGSGHGDEGDGLSSFAPFGGDEIGQGLGGQNKRRGGRRARAPAVQPHGEPGSFGGHIHRLIETPNQADLVRIGERHTKL